MNFVGGKCRPGQRFSNDQPNLHFGTKQVLVGVRSASSAENRSTGWIFLSIFGYSFGPVFSSNFNDG